MLLSLCLIIFLRVDHRFYPSCRHAHAWSTSSWKKLMILAWCWLFQNAAELKACQLAHHSDNCDGLIALEPQLHYFPKILSIMLALPIDIPMLDHDQAGRLLCHCQVAADLFFASLSDSWFFRVFYSLSYWASSSAFEKAFFCLTECQTTVALGGEIFLRASEG